MPSPAISGDNEPPTIWSEIHSFSNRSKPGIPRTNAPLVRPLAVAITCPVTSGLTLDNALEWPSRRLDLFAIIVNGIRDAPATSICPFTPKIRDMMSWRKAVHDGHYNDQCRHTQRDAKERETGDDRRQNLPGGRDLRYRSATMRSKAPNIIVGYPFAESANRK